MSSRIPSFVARFLSPARSPLLQPLLFSIGPQRIYFLNENFMLTTQRVGALVGRQ